MSTQDESDRPALLAQALPLAHPALLGQARLGRSRKRTGEKALEVDTIDEFMDRRRHRRIAAGSSARINFDGFWHSCPTVDLSGGGGSFRSWLQPPEGSNVLVQMRGLGVIRARVTRRWDQGFAVRFDAEDYDAEALVDNLTLPANPGLFGPGGHDTAPETPAEAEPDLPEGEPATTSDDVESREAVGEGTRAHPLRSLRKALK